jgi:hypothetical protein
MSSHWLPLYGLWPMRYSTNDLSLTPAQSHIHHTFYPVTIIQGDSKVPMHMKELGEGNSWAPGSPGDYKFLLAPT